MKLAAQVVQTLPLRKTKRKIKTMKLVAQVAQTLLLGKKKRELKTMNLAAQVVQTLLLGKTKRKIKTMKVAGQKVQTLSLRKIKKVMNNKVASFQVTDLRWIPHLAAIPKWGQESLEGRHHLIMLLITLFHQKHTHLLARGCHQRVKRKKGCRVKGSFVKLSGFKLMDSLRYYILV